MKKIVLISLFLLGLSGLHSVSGTRAGLYSGICGATAGALSYKVLSSDLSVDNKTMSNVLNYAIENKGVASIAVLSGVAYLAYKIFSNFTPAAKYKKAKNIFDEIAEKNLDKVGLSELEEISGKAKTARVLIESAKLDVTDSEVFDDELLAHSLKFIEVISDFNRLRGYILNCRDELSNLSDPSISRKYRISRWPLLEGYWQANVIKDSMIDYLFKLSSNKRYIDDLYNDSSCVRLNREQKLQLKACLSFYEQYENMGNDIITEVSNLIKVISDDDHFNCQLDIYNADCQYRAQLAALESAKINAEMEAARLRMSR